MTIIATKKKSPNKTTAKAIAQLEKGHGKTIIINSLNNSALKRAVKSLGASIYYLIKP